MEITTAKSAGAQRIWRLLPVAIAAFVLALTGCSVAQQGVDAVENVGKSDTGRAKVGDCINVIEGSMVDSKTEPVDCASPRAVYKVAKVYKKAEVYSAAISCTADQTSYEETMKGMTVASLCLTPNFQQGSCYHESMTTGYQYAECGSPDASFRVVARIDGQSSEGLCGSNSDSVITLTEPPTTFCLQKI